VILQPRKQLGDHVVQVHLLSSQTRVITRTLTIRHARRQVEIILTTVRAVERPSSYRIRTSGR
jgi:hypothetical protein